VHNPFDGINAVKPCKPFCKRTERNKNTLSTAIDLR